jgi:hypothetical protein
MRGYADNLGLAIHVTDVLALERFLFLGHLPTQLLQDAFHPPTGPDVLASVATVFYFLHFPLPIAVGFFLWLRRRRVYYDYVAALILLAMAGFATYVLLPVAPPWWAAQHGYLPGPTGAPAIVYLKEQGFDQLASFFGFEGRYIYSYTIYDINPNQVAAFPSLHAAFPFLGFLFTRRAFGRIGWILLVYSVFVWLSIVYLADHYVVDILGGLLYASVAYWAVIHAPAWFRRVIDDAADPELEAGVEAADAGDSGALARLGRHARWSVVGQGVVVAVAGALMAYWMNTTGALGGGSTGLYLIPWAAMVGGAWRAAAGLLSR